MPNVSILCRQSIILFRHCFCIKDLLRVQSEIILTELTPNPNFSVTCINEFLENMVVFASFGEIPS